MLNVRTLIFDDKRPDVSGWNVLLIFFITMDVVLTLDIVSRSDITAELNPIMYWVLSNLGFQGFAGFKLLMAGLVPFVMLGVRRYILVLLVLAYALVDLRSAFILFNM